jgi:hypothetical protein
VIRLYSPRSEGETALLKSILTAAAIPHFVHNDFFGSLRVGPQIDLLNMKTIMVPEESREQAQELILDYLQATLPAPKPTLLRDKVRNVIEFLLFGWFIPGRIPCRKAYNQMIESEEEAV